MLDRMEESNNLFLANMEVFQSTITEIKNTAPSQRSETGNLHCLSIPYIKFSFFMWTIEEINYRYFPFKNVLKGASFCKEKLEQKTWNTKSDNTQFMYTSVILLKCTQIMLFLFVSRPNILNLNHITNVHIHHIIMGWICIVQGMCLHNFCCNYNVKKLRFIDSRCILVQLIVRNQCFIPHTNKYGLINTDWFSLNRFRAFQHRYTTTTII